MNPNVLTPPDLEGLILPIGAGALMRDQELIGWMRATLIAIQCGVSAEEAIARLDKAHPDWRGARGREGG